MVHFAIISVPFPSHVRAHEALACALIDRGHSVSWVGPAGVLRQIVDQRIRRCEVGRTRWPTDWTQSMVNRAARPGSPWGLRRVIQDMGDHSETLCDEGRQILRQICADVLIVDEMEAAGALLGDALGLPWISVACALPLAREPSVPLPVMHWGLATDTRALHRNAVSERIYDWLMGPHAARMKKLCAMLGARSRTSLVDGLSPWLQLSQTTAEFDFPRAQAPRQLRHVGPLRQQHPDDLADGLCCLAQRDSKPFVFASLGTLQGWRFGLFKRIALACRAIDARLLIAHCARLNKAQCNALERAGATWVTDFAPQRAALARADVCVTHAGLNTVLDALEAGTPVLALPIAFDQPGVAARAVHAGVGLSMLPAFATSASIARALQRLLGEPTFRDRAAVLSASVAAAGGTRAAVDAIEKALCLPQRLRTSQTVAEKATYAT